MRKLSKAVAAASATVLVILVPGAEAAQKSEVARFPVAGDVETNPCTGEQITFTKGSFQIVERQAEDGGGGTHLIVEGNAQGVEGVTPAGVRYRGAGGFWLEANGTSGGAETFTVTDVFNLVSQGSGDNSAIQTAFHVSTDADGDVTAFVMNFADGGCRG
jgi:hypothetical protein